MPDHEPDDHEEELSADQPTGPDGAPCEMEPESVWAIVANVRKEHPYGPGGLETKSGTRQFRGGAKVYIAGCFPGTCDVVVAIGLHRKSRRFITCAVDVGHLESFRVKLVYHPSVIERIRRDESCWLRTKEEAEEWAKAFPEWQAFRKKKAEE